MSVVRATYCRLPETLTFINVQLGRNYFETETPPNLWSKAMKNQRLREDGPVLLRNRSVLESLEVSNCLAAGKFLISRA